MTLSPSTIAELILLEAEDKHGVTRADLLSRRRKAIPAKNYAAREMRRWGLTLSEIGRAMHTDHTTAHYRATQGAGS